MIFSFLSGVSHGAILLVIESAPLGYWKMMKMCLCRQ